MPSNNDGMAEHRRTRPSVIAAVWPSAAVLILAGSFHAYRGVPAEGIVFVLVGLAIAADRAGWLPRPRPHTFRLPGPRASAALAVLGAFALTVLPMRGIAEAVAIAAVGVLVMVVGWWQPDRTAAGSTERYRRTALLWCCVGVVVCLWELAVFLLADPPLHEYEYPTLSYLLQPIVDQPAGRGLLLVAWIAVGLALLRWSQGGITKAAGHAGPPGHPDASGDGRADPDIGA